jgi:hypothetical protein
MRARLVDAGAAFFLVSIGEKTHHLKSSSVLVFLNHVEQVLDAAQQADD